jgi:hypothetical protein
MPSMTAAPAHEGIVFERLDRRASDATLWSGGDLDIPCGELDGERRVAWIRGALTALFGPIADHDSSCKSTFDIELRATVDGQREVRLIIGDRKGELGAGFGRFGAARHDPSPFSRVREALLHVLEHTPPADYASKFTEHSFHAYGVRRGIPWVGTSKKGRVDCHPRPGSILAMRARGPLVLELEGAREAGVARSDAAAAYATARAAAIGEAELRAYYDAHVPAGGTPLDGRATGSSRRTPARRPRCSRALRSPRSSTI